MMGLGLGLARRHRSPGAGYDPVPDPDAFETRPTYLEYREAGSATWLVETGTARRVPDTDRVVHHVKLSGLSPDTTILFRLPDYETLAWYVTYEDDPTTTLTVHWHTTQPMPDGGYTEPVSASLEFASYTMPATLPVDGLRIAQISDTHGRDANHDHLSRLAERGARLIVHSGDMATGNGGEAGPGTWYIWFEAMKAAMDSQDRLIPLIAAIGNHEAWAGGSGIQWTEGGHVGNKPDFDLHVRGDTEWYYCFYPSYPGLTGYGVLDFGDYLSLWTLDPGISTRWDEGQSDWLAATLAARSTVPHRLVSMHYSPWPTGRRMMVPYVRTTRSLIGPILQAGGVRLVLVGHEHVLSKTVAVNDWGELDHQTTKFADPDGVVFVGSGPGGGGARSGRNPATKWWIDDSRPSEIEYYEFEQDSFPSSSPGYEPREPHPDDGTTYTEDEVSHFWEIDLTDTGRTVRAVNGVGGSWGEFSQSADTLVLA